LIRVLLFFLLFNLGFADDKWTPLRYDSSKAPADNPLKGFIPYTGDGLDNKFPHSMEWFYLSLKDIMNGPKSFTFDKSLEPKLKEAATRGKQSVFRIYLDYPGKKPGIPDFLIKHGHKMLPYKNDDHDNKGGLSPDYRDENLIKAMESSILEMGRLYDGDPRIGFITVGYLGHWGEWHTYPNEHLMAKRSAQLRIIKAFHKAFKTTPFLLRYPADIEKSIPCGLHDDSFAFSTLPGKKEDWHFLTLSKESKTLDIWKAHPIGGEIYPPLQKKIWSSKPPKKTQNYEKCVEQTHCTWLINNAVFNGKWKNEDKTKAINAAKKLGYEFYATAFKVDKGILSIKITNKGVAPFYYKWPVSVVDRRTNKELKTDWDITSILPGENKEFNIKFSGSTAAIKITNPMPSGPSIRFANETQVGDTLLLK
jgi:hypothetical protein